MWRMVLFAVGISLALPVAAQTSDAPCPAPGSQFRFSDGAWVEGASDLGGGMCRLKDRRTGNLFEKFIGGLLPSAPTVKSHLAELRPIVPFAVGKNVGFQYAGADDKGANVTWTITVSVEKYETASTPAGTWPAFVILYAEEILGGSGRWERRWWYSPQLGYPIKYQFRTVRGHPPVRTPADTHLVEFIPK